jgi:two-component system LytT family response regulator
LRETLKMYSAVIVDDEQVYHDEITFQLKGFPSYRIAGNCFSVAEAAEKIKEVKPDLVFLDVKLPPQTGFDLLSQLGTIDFQIIFTTSFMEYAIKAFEVSAVDFLLKPITGDSMQRALAKFEKKFMAEKSYSSLEYLVEKLYNKLQISAKVAIAEAKCIHIVEVKNILRCQAAGRYTDFYLLDGKKMTSTRNLGEYQQQLEEQNFLRIHDSHIISLDHVVKYIKGDGGEIELTDGSIIDVSRPYKKQLLTKLNLKTGFKEFLSSVFSS